MFTVSFWMISILYISAINVEQMLTRYCKKRTSSALIITQINKLKSKTEKMYGNFLALFAKKTYLINFSHMGLVILRGIRSQITHLNTVFRWCNKMEVFLDAIKYFFLISNQFSTLRSRRGQCHLCSQHTQLVFLSTDELQIGWFGEWTATH